MFSIDMSLCYDHYDASIIFFEYQVAWMKTGVGLVHTLWIGSTILFSNSRCTNYTFVVNIHFYKTLKILLYALFYGLISLQPITSCFGVNVCTVIGLVAFYLIHCLFYCQSKPTLTRKILICREKWNKWKSSQFICMNSVF